MFEPVMTQLRAATAREHHDLEEVVAIGEQLKSHASYRRLLVIFYGFVRPIEEELGRQDWSPMGVNFEERRKAALLEADLETLGIEPSELANCSHMPALNTQAEACGALYVMEGSTLGGQHILRMAEKANLNPSALRYFRSYGERVGEMWKKFGAAVNAFTQQNGLDAEVIEGARKTFRAFRSWFQVSLATR